jgi:hypothetical protein
MIDPARPTAGFRDERLSALRDEQTLRGCGLDAPGHSRIPPVRDPWAEDPDQLRAARGISLGTALSLGLWTLVVLVVLLVLAVLA